MQKNDSGFRAFPNNAQINSNLRVELSAGYLVASGATSLGLGTLPVRTEATDASATVQFWNTAGSRFMIASGAIAANALAYAGASGKVAATGSIAVGINIGAASTADGDLVEILPFSQAGIAFAQVETKTADYTVTIADSGKTFSTAGAAGTVVFALPAALAGMKYRFRVGAAQELRIDPNGSETISLPSTGVPGAAGKYLTANAAGETVDLQCDVAGTWSVYGFTGTWTAEA